MEINTYLVLWYLNKRSLHVCTSTKENFEGGFKGGGVHIDRLKQHPLNQTRGILLRLELGL